MTAAEGIGKFLNSEDVSFFVDGFVRGMAYDNDIDSDKAKKIFFAEFDIMSESIQDAIVGRVNDWIQFFKQNQQEYGIQVTENLKEEANTRVKRFPLPDVPDDI